MENKSKFRALLLFLSFPCLVMIACLSFACYMAYKECRTNSDLVKESLRGNRYAVAILAKYEKPWKLDERIVYGAMQGNPYALKVLDIDEKLNPRFNR